MQNCSKFWINKPLLILPSAISAIMSVSPEPEVCANSQPKASRFVGRRGEGLSRIHDGVAIIDVYGTLVNRGPWVGEFFGATSYEGLNAQVRSAAQDSSISGIILSIDSHGGEASGLYSLASEIRHARSIKPVISVVNDYAASAAYGIASSASEVWITPTSTLGSIGVVLVHLDHSQMLSEIGIKPTIIQVGSKKSVGNPLEPLSDDDANELLRIVRLHYNALIDVVAAGRAGKLSAEDAMKTDAAVYVGEESLNIGLADKIGNIHEAILYLSGKKQKNVFLLKGVNMQKEKESLEVTSSGAQSVDVVASNDGHDGTADLERSIRLDERSRIEQIICCEEASGRMNAALSIALNSDLSPDQAKSLLAGLPLEGKSRATPSIDERMPSSTVAAGIPAADKKVSAVELWHSVYAEVQKN